MYKYVTLILLLVLSCQYKQSKNSTITTDISKKTYRTVKNYRGVKEELVESFVDSTTIGKKSFNKVEVRKYIVADSNYVVIKFYSKKNNKWIIKNEFHFEKDGVSDCDTKIADFNHDGFKDMTYVSAIAARGANEVRTLFIYDKENDRLIYIKNSEFYPNMQYNKTLNCIDAFLVYGGCSTVFLKISGDSLREIANVELFDGLTVTTYDKNGKEKIILKEPQNKIRDIRYSNYKPLTQYKGYGSGE